MISFLGVSKAVLDNVIFCHQEESNWWVSGYMYLVYKKYVSVLTKKLHLSRSITWHKLHVNSYAHAFTVNIAFVVKTNAPQGEQVAF